MQCPRHTRNAYFLAVGSIFSVAGRSLYNKLGTKWEGRTDSAVPPHTRPGAHAHPEEQRGGHSVCTVTFPFGNLQSF